MISVNKLSFAYKNTLPIFEDFSLQIEQGSLFGLLGPNGAGKTTLISLIAGLYSPTSGTVSIADKSLQGNKQEILEMISLVPQEYAFYGQLTAHENLNFFARLYPQNKDTPSISKTIDKAIELTGITEYQHRKASTFSGGLKRRLNLAIGLLNNPQLLILDEPTVGIDPQSRHFILQAIEELNAQGITIIYTSHYMTEVEQLCNDIAIIDHGAILQQGTLEDLLGDSQAIEVHLNRTLNGLTLPKKTLNYFKQHGFLIDDTKLTCADFNTTQLPGLLSALKPVEQLDVAINRINTGSKTLEDVFFELTNTTLRD